MNTPLPNEPGLYWARYRSSAPHKYDLLVRVCGKAPYLKIDKEVVAIWRDPLALVLIDAPENLVWGPRLTVVDENSIFHRKEKP